MARKEPPSAVFRSEGGSIVVEDAVFENNSTVFAAKNAEVDLRRSRFTGNGTDIWSDGSEFNIENVHFAAPPSEPSERKPPRRAKGNKGHWGGIPLMPWKREREEQQPRRL
jgi:hypothetical protein